MQTKTKAHARSVKDASLRATPSGRSRAKVLDASKRASIMPSKVSSARRNRMTKEFKLSSPKEVVTLFDEAIERFKGSSSVLESAIGAYMLGRNVGWKPLLLIHDKKTIKKYETVLGVNFREHMAPEGSLARKSVAYKGAIKIGNFWKVVSGAAGARSTELDKKD